MRSASFFVLRFINFHGFTIGGCSVSWRRRTSVNCSIVSSKFFAFLFCCVVAFALIVWIESREPEKQA